jgi:hypothetical protein
MVSAVGVKGTNSARTSQGSVNHDLRLSAGHSPRFCAQSRMINWLTGPEIAGLSPMLPKGDLRSAGRRVQREQSVIS